MVANLLLCSNIIFTKKEFCMQHLIFCVYDVAQDKFFTQKIQKSQESFFFEKHDYHFFLFHFCFKSTKKKSLFSQPPKIQTKNYLAIYKKLHFCYIIPCEKIKINLHGYNHQKQFICVVTSGYTLGFLLTKNPWVVFRMKLKN